MSALFLAILVCAIVSLSWLLTGAVRRIALHHNVLDIPTARSLHTIPTPRGGGLSIVLVFLTAVIVLFRIGAVTSQETVGLLAGCAVAIVGGWDDRVSLPIRIRLPIHFLSAATAFFSVLTLQPKPLLSMNSTESILVVVVILISLVWLINLTNFMDGIDGLAGTECLTVAGICCALSILSHGMGAMGLLYAALAAAAQGFLLWNWHPARIFMGDVGSGFLGYCFGVLMLIGGIHHTITPAVPIILLGVFIVDATYTLVNRILHKEAWYAPHRSHAYQHLAGRIGHARTTAMVAACNLLWLGPWAAIVQWHPKFALPCLLAAWTPLVVVAHFLGAGDSSGSWERRLADVPFTAPIYIVKQPYISQKRVDQLRQYIRRYGFYGKHFVLSILNAGCLYMAVMTRYDGDLPHVWAHRLPKIALLWCITQAFVLLLFRASRSHWRFTAAREVPAVAGIALAGALAGGLTTLGLVHTGNFPRALPGSVYVLDAFYSVAVLAGLRLGCRIVFEQTRPWLNRSCERRVLIYGANKLGVSILSELRLQCPDHRALGFIDERPDVHGTSLSGIAVLGGKADLQQLVTKHRVDGVYAPAHLLSEETEKALLQACLEAKVGFRRVPTISKEIILKRPRLSTELVLEDLLGRKPIQLDTAATRECVEGQVVMITGAAGSIGSELCRQLARFSPRAIIGYEISETALFYLERQMQDLSPSVPFIPCIGSVQNCRRLLDVLQIHRPAVVYHAAAYKHVPLMEEHLFEAIENNIFGTETLLRACERSGVSRFVMISTDKAARPTSLMGTTKRVAEIVVRASKVAGLTCVSTRFGNVLGSNGSVIPIFREQILKGGPVTVTHPDMVRFFMTIPEAAQLVLQASSLGTANEIFVLDMGAPVRIVDLAERMIRLAGMIPGKDIEIQYTGMRPGEKLYEELSTCDEKVVPTSLQGVSVFHSHANISDLELRIELDALRDAVDRRSEQEALMILQRIVPEYIGSKLAKASSEPCLVSAALQPGLHVA